METDPFIVGMIIHRVTTLFGAFQELNAMQEACSNAPSKKDDDDLLLEAGQIDIIH